MSSDSRQSLMDELLRGGIPEIKLGLGEAIDRENARPLPPRYARLLPETLLVVTLRPDAADALQPIAADLERELTDSCTRHGSLYDRAYRVRLQRSADRDAPLYVVSTHSGRDIGGGGPADSPAVPNLAPAGAPAAAGAVGALQKPKPAEGSRTPASASEAAGFRRQMPMSESDVTRVAADREEDWHSGRWLLVVESAGGEEREVFRISQPVVTVGRRTDDPELRATIAISEAPSVSRRQLALQWENRDGAAGFKVYNLGLNTVHLPGRDIPGSRTGKTFSDLESIDDEFTGWLPPGVPMRIGDHGPTLRVEEVPPAQDDVDDGEATVYE